MLWVILAIITALLTGLVSIIDKKILLKHHSMEFSAAFSLTNLILAFSLIKFVNFDLTLNNFLLIYGISWLGTLGFLFTSKAIRHMEISTVTPLMNFGPGLVALLALIILEETIKITQWAGIILLLFGGYILETRHLKNYKLFFYKLKTSKGLHYLLLGLLFYSFTAIGDKFVINNITNVNTYLFFVLIFIAINFLILSGFISNGYNDIKKILKNNWMLFILTGLLTFGYRLTQMYAISLANVASVLSIKRLSVLVVVLFGGELFHENNIKRKLLASFIMLIGVFLIIL